MNDTEGTHGVVNEMLNQLDGTGHIYEVACFPNIALTFVVDDFFLPPFVQHNSHQAVSISTARELFLSCLSPKQAKQFAANGCIDVIGSEGGHYRLQCDGRSFSFNIIGGFNRSTHVKMPDYHRPDSKLLPWLFCYCVAGKGGYSLPVWDHYLTQKSWIEADEINFMAKANAMQIYSLPFGGVAWYAGMPT